MALLAWEAANDRLRETLKPPVGYPNPDLPQLADAFANLAARLDDLKCAFLLRDTVEPVEGNEN
jgi:hypothetical protein